MIKELFKYPTRFYFLLATLIGFFLLRFPSLFEPHWYGDESIYEAVGYALRHGRILYSGIWDNKPPVLYLIYALVNGDLFGVKVLSLIFGLLAVIVFFALSEKVFHKKTAVYASTVFFALFFALPMFEGNIANAENFLLFPVILTAYLIYSKATHPEKSLFFVTGLIIGITFLLKIVAIFDLTAFILFVACVTHKKTVPISRSFLRSLLPLVIGFCLPLLLTSLYFLIAGSFMDFAQSTFLSNIGYVNVDNQYFIPQGLLIIKTVLLLCFLFLLLKSRAFIKNNVLFIGLWFSFALYSALFSQRPYTHYLLVLLPAFSLAVGLFFELRQKEKVVLVGCLTLLTVLLLRFYWYNNPKETIAYYSNFLSFILGKKDVTAYEASFDSRVPRDYDIVAYLKSHLRKSDTLFIWGDAAEIYPLTHTLPIGRYTVAYHMKANQQTLDESMQDFDRVKPDYIVILPDVGYIPFYLSPYKERVELDGARIYERTF